MSIDLLEPASSMAPTIGSPSRVCTENWQASRSHLEVPGKATVRPSLRGDSSPSAVPSTSVVEKVPYFRVRHEILREPLLMVNHYGCDPLTTFTFREPCAGEDKWVSDILSLGSMYSKSPASCRGWDLSPFSPSNSPLAFPPTSPMEGRISFCLSSPDTSPKCSKLYPNLHPKLSNASSRLHASTVSPMSTETRKGSVAAQRRALLDAEHSEIQVFKTRVLDETSAHGIVATDVRADWEQLVSRIGGENMTVEEVRHHVLDHDDLDNLACLCHIFDRMGCYVLAERVIRQRQELCRSDAALEYSETLSCLSTIGLLLQRQGKHPEAYDVHVALHEKRLAALGHDHPDTLCSAVRLGVCMRRQGMVAEAEKALHEAYHRCMSALGKDHSVTLEALREYLLFLLDYVRLSEVDAFAEDLCPRHTAALGEDDSDMLAATSVYCWILHHRGEEEEAARKCREIIAIATTRFGAHHPIVLQYSRQLAVYLETIEATVGGDIMKDLVVQWCTMSGSGSLRALRSAHDAGVYLSRTHHFKSAAGYFRLAANGFRKTVGAQNYFTIMCQSKLSRALFYAMDYAGAIVPMRNVYEGVAQLFGEESEARYRALNNLAIAHCRNHQFTEAVECAREAASGWNCIAALHPEKTVEALISVQNLGIVLQSMYKFSEAEKLFHRAYNGWSQALGELHENTLLALHYIGVVLRDQRRMQEAEPILMRVLKLRTEVLGPDDPDTLDSHHQMAVWHKISRNTEKAFVQHEYAENRRMEIVGPNHMDSLMSRYHIGLLYTQIDNIADAIDLLLECLRDAGEIFGWNHPFTLNVLNALANAYAEASDESRADKYYRKALAGLEKIYGPSHPDTLRLVRNLATNYLYLKQYDVAEGYWRRAMDGMIQFQGPDHPETLWTVVQLALVLELRFKDIEAEKYYKWVERGRKNLSQTDMSTLDPQSFPFLDDIERLTRGRRLISNSALLCIVKVVAENVAVHMLNAMEHVRKMWKQKRCFCPRRYPPQDALADFSLRDEVNYLMENEIEESEVSPMLTP